MLVRQDNVIFLPRPRWIEIRHNAWLHLCHTIGAEVIPT